MNLEVDTFAEFDGQAKGAKMRNREFSQTEEIINALESGEGITAIDALERWGCLRLAARIGELRQEGYNIITKTIKQNGKQYAEYRLI